VVRRPSDGFVLMATCVALTILLAFAALGIDIARMYVIKSELQAYTDAAALSGVLALDGGSQSFSRARDSVTQLANGPRAMKWDLGTKSITEITAAFAQGSPEPDPSTWTQAPGDPAGYRFVRVVASAQAPLVFLRMFEARESSKIAASSVAVRAADAARLVE
jgi:uncharacterized membrane protein